MATTKVKADVFEFYLKSYGLDSHPSELATKARVDEAKIETWRNTDSDIAISDLRLIANIYKKHWGIFLLNKPPESFKKPKDYRARTSRSDLGLLSRLAFEEANRLIEISHIHGVLDISSDVQSLRKRKLSPQALAIEVRKLIGLKTHKQSSWKDKQAWRFLENKAEELGFIVSMQALDEGVDGFIVIKDEGVAVVINRDVKSTYRQTFTLMHELGHYFQDVSAICNTYELVHDDSAENFADEFASNILMPQPNFELEESVVEIRSSRRPVNEKDYELIAKKYCISMSQVAVRFYKIDLISWNTLMTQLKKAEKLFQQSQKSKLEKMKERKGFDPNGHERKAISRMSVPIVHNLLSEYHSGKMTAKDFASTVGVSINLVGRIESMIGNESS